MRALLTPAACQGRIVELSTGGTRRVFRKKILPIGELDYDGRKLRFDRPYLERVKGAYDAHAFDHVPLQLATPKNEHNNDPELTRGVIEDLELAADGLYARVGMGKRGAELVDEFPELAVSVRLVEGHQGHPAALQHVLATWDPRVTRMGAWEPVDLSNTSRPVVIDLSGLDYRPLTQGGRKGRTVPASFTREQVDAAVQAAVDAALADAESGPSDDELEQAAEDFFGDLTEDGADTGEGAEGVTAGEAADDEFDADFEGIDARDLVEASAQHATALEMSNVRGDNLEATVLELTRERDAARWATERDRWGQAGIPAAAVDLCRPLLEGTGKDINLSNGETVDVASRVREVLGHIAKNGLVDMSRAIGSSHDPDDADRQSETDRLAAVQLAALGYATEA